MTKEHWHHMSRFGLAVAVSVVTLGLSLSGQTAVNNNLGADFAPKPPVLARSAEDEAKSFVLPPGYRMELVLSDPDIINPAVIEFDGNGRMYVAEFQTYMPDVDGDHEHDPVNRITRWEDTHGDGKYDKRTVFADKLMLPRGILPLDNNSILTNETDSDDMVKWTDTNNDGVADKREVVFSGVGLNRDGNLEHEQSGFVWGLDNWIYSTYNSFRFRWTPSGMEREATGGSAGQWGLAQDDDGKMWFVCAGCERGPENFQVPIEYGRFQVSDQFEPGFETAWPLAGVGDMQGGMGRVRMPVGTLNHFTATNGPAIVRAPRMPDDLQGDLLFCEPVGRLIRRAKIVKTEGLTQLRNAYPGSEFLLSTDPLFRPVNIRNAPDGTIYIADMYHGIIQEAQWTGPGSYLRSKIQQYQLDKILDHGRIWRLRFDGTAEVPATPQGPAATPTPAVPAQPALEPDHTHPHMLDESAAELVAHLTSPNGWWRDTAQRLLVLKQDKSVVPALQSLVRTSDVLVGRFHALWTLEGLGALDPALVREALKDPNPRMRIQAIRASETLYKGGDRSFEADYRNAAKDTDADVAIQAMLTLNTLKVTDSATVIQTAMASNRARGVQEIGRQILQPPPAAFGAGGRGGSAYTPEQQQILQRGETIYAELCYTCHGSDGRGAPLEGAPEGTTMAPPLSGSAHVQGHRDFVIKVLLNGLIGQNNGKTYTEVMIPMGAQKDEWIAAAASYIRNSFGNTSSVVTAADVARVRAATAARKASWTVAEIENALPVLLQAQPTWTVSASANTEKAVGALTLAGWTSGAPQTAGMWFQIEFPEPTLVTELQFDAANTGRAAGPGARGAAAPVGAGRGPGGAPAAPSGAATGSPAGGAPTPVPVAPFVSPSGFVRAYQVQVSADGRTWGKPIATGDGSPLTTIAFAPVRAKFIRITETGAIVSAPPWSVLNLKVFVPPSAPATR